jgi:molecular chaperone GrpE
LSMSKDKRKKHEGGKTAEKHRLSVEEQEKIKMDQGQSDTGLKDAAVEAEQAAEKKLSLEDKLAETEDRYLRARAELDNFKRRSEREKSELSSFVKITLLRDIIPLLDDFKRFFEHVENGENSLDESFVQGVEMIRNSLVKILEKHGVEAVEKTGVPVDYNLHEAVLTEPVKDKEKDHTVLQVLEVGYRIGDKLIRPAKVTVGIYSK